jgi:hypothetical protein
MATRRGAISTDNWGVRLIDLALYPFALVATPGFLLFLMIFFVGRAFANSSGSGVRSFSAVLLPLMVLALLVAFKREKLKRAERVGNLWIFVGTLLIGLGVMELLSLAPTGVPISELVLSGSFSVLLFSSVSLSRDRAMFYYFGTILGFLSYVVLLGFPTLR